MLTRKEKFEQNLSPNVLWLVKRLIRTEQAKTGLVIFMSNVLHISHDEALKFYKEYSNEQSSSTPPA